MSVRAIQTMTTLVSGTESAGVNSISLAAGQTLTKEYREFASYNRAMFILDVQTLTGTSPTLDVRIDAQDPVSLKWFQVAAFPQQTAATGAQTAGSVTNVITPITAELYATNYRASFTVGGTGSPTATASLVAIVNAEEPITVGFDVP